MMRTLFIGAGLALYGVTIYFVVNRLARLAGWLFAKALRRLRGVPPATAPSVPLVTDESTPMDFTGQPLDIQRGLSLQSMLRGGRWERERV